MSNIGICEYVIGVIHDKDIWYYVGEYGADGEKLEPRQESTSFLPTLSAVMIYKSSAR